MIACPKCGTGLPAGSRFCLQCGTPIAPPPPIAEERKTVTTLFCDLVAFTAMSESADPEDVDALLGEYFARATKVIESHGGTVEKFIGDAVVGVFGVPAVHEDDPERAVRAGLRLIEALEGMTRPDGSPLQARCGVNTGEALVRLDVDPASGKGFLTGDAVNTAARLEAAAPPGGVCVGALTHALTERVIAYEELPPVDAKGKAEPVAAWHAKAALARTGLRTTGAADTPFIGREKELERLLVAFDAACGSDRARVVLLIGEPGIGKSRLVLELARALEARPGLVTWRQGRCLPYGEGVTFSALSEIVKAHAGILDSDDIATVESKLEAVLPDGEEGLWLRQRLHPLIGLQAAQASREESFAAWRRFLEVIAKAGPTVLVFEDLHWADEVMLSFIEWFTEEAPDGPLLVLATTRRELLEKHRQVIEEGEERQRIFLAPLADEEIDRLLGVLLKGQRAADMRPKLAKLAYGNPLYAEQYVRLVLERGAADSTLNGSDTGRNDALPLPGAVQAVVAARLDALPPPLKAFLCDAAVFGEAFWLRGVVHLGDRSEEQAAQMLTELTRRQLVRRASKSSLGGETEYLFWHALTHDVAYRQLPRATRARQHVGVAEWIETKTSARPEDLADVLARHYSTAFDLASATGSPDAESLVAPTVRYLSLAGDRTLALDCATAEQYYAKALKMAQSRGIDCAGIRISWGKALGACGRYREAAPVLREACAEFEARGDSGEAAIAMVLLAGDLAHLGEPESRELYERSLALVEGAEPSPELVFVLERRAGDEWVTTGDPETSRPAVERVIAMAAELALPPPPQALTIRGAIRCQSGDAGGLDDFRRAVESAKAQGLGTETALQLQNYCVALSVARGPDAEKAAADESIEFAKRRGLTGRVLEGRQIRIESLWLGGSWDQALEEAAVLGPELHRVGDVWSLINLRLTHIMLLAARGDVDESRRLAEWLASLDREGRLIELSGNYAHQVAAATAFAGGSVDDALTSVGAWAETPPVVTDMVEVMFVPVAVRIALAGDDVRLAERLARQMKPVFPPHVNVITFAHAGLHEHVGDAGWGASEFAAAALGWHDFGVPYEEAQALLGQARCLVALGRAGEAVGPFQQAREIFARLGAKPALAETEERLGRAASPP